MRSQAPAALLQQSDPVWRPATNYCGPARLSRRASAVDKNMTQRSAHAHQRIQGALSLPSVQTAEQEGPEEHGPGQSKQV